MIEVHKSLLVVGSEPFPMRPGKQPATQWSGNAQRMGVQGELVGKNRAPCSPIVDAWVALTGPVPSFSVDMRVLNTVPSVGLDKVAATCHQIGHPRDAEKEPTSVDSLKSAERDARGVNKPIHQIAVAIALQRRVGGGGGIQKGVLG